MTEPEDSKSAAASWQIDLDEYIRQGEPDQAERSAAWETAIGLQAVDGLKTSDYLLETAKQHIEGEITITDAQRRIESYYENRSDRRSIERSAREADIVSSRITELLQERTFQFSPVELKQIHRRLFEGTFSHAGKFRTYNISKHEWILNGASVIYASYDNLNETLEYDFAQEAAFSYLGLPISDVIKRIVKFTSGIWQIHPFGEGNTRTTAVFIVKYLRTLGFEPDHTAFAENSWYFRNALVRANYNNVQAGIHETSVYLDRFFENLLTGANNELKNRFMHVDYHDSVQVTVQDKVNTVQVTVQAEKLVEVMGDSEYTTAELMSLVGMKHRATFMSNYLNPAIAAGLVERTIPEKPRSGNQKYRKARR